jgi:hypothetical protein
MINCVGVRSFNINYSQLRNVTLHNFNYPFNIVHNVKYLRFRLVILHIGLYGGSQKFVRIFWGGWGWGKPIGGIHSSYSYSSSCYRHIHVLFLFSSLFFCITLLRIHIYLHDFHFNHLSSHVRPLELRHVHFQLCFCHIFHS